MKLSVSSARAALLKDHSFKGLRNQLQGMFVLHDSHSKLILIREARFISEASLLPADLTIEDQPLYSVVAVMENDGPVIKCGWREQVITPSIDYDEFRKQVASCQSVQITGNPLARQSAFLWVNANSTWRVVSPSKTRHSFPLFKTIYTQLKPAHTYHMIDFESFNQAAQQEDIVYNQKVTANTWVNVQQVSDFENRVQWNGQYKQDLGQFVSDCCHRRNCASHVIVPIPTVYYRLDVQRESNVLCGWGALIQMKHTSSFGSVTVVYREQDQLRTVVYGCDSLQFSRDLLMHPQPMSKFTQAVVVCNRVARNASDVGLQILANLTQEELCLDQAIAFPHTLDLSVGVNWRTYYSLSVFSVWESVPLDRRDKPCKAFNDRLQMIINADIHRTCPQHAIKAAHQYITDIFNSFKFSTVTEFFEAFQHSEDWGNANFKGRTFPMPRLNSQILSLDPPVYAHKRRRSAVRSHSQGSRQELSSL